MTTTKKHVAAKVRLTLTLDPALHKLILEESAKMFMLPTKWVEFCIVTRNQANQKTSLTNSKSKPKVEKRVWPRIPLPGYIPAPNSATWRYNGEPIPAMNLDGHSYMDKDTDANGQAFSRSLWYNYIEPLLSEHGIDCETLDDWEEAAELIKDYLAPDTIFTGIPPNQAEANARFVEGFVAMVASGDMLEYVALNEGCVPRLVKD
jgi:hypothetical protein